jgi:hypothetical protein
MIKHKQSTGKNIKYLKVNYTSLIADSYLFDLIFIHTDQKTRLDVYLKIPTPSPPKVNRFSFLVIYH